MIRPAASSGTGFRESFMLLRRDSTTAQGAEIQHGACGTGSEPRPRGARQASFPKRALPHAHPGQNPQIPQNQLPGLR